MVRCGLGRRYAHEERRYKVWKLGFKDFQGIDYINDEKLNSKFHEKIQEEITN